MRWLASIATEKRGDVHYTMHGILHKVFWNRITSSGTNIREKGSLSALEIVYILILYFHDGFTIDSEYSKSML